MDIRNEQELDAAIRLQQVTNEAALLKRAKSGLSSLWLAACVVPAGGLLAGGSALKAGALGGLFALIFVLIQQANDRVSAVVELLALRGSPRPARADGAGDAG